MFEETPHASGLAARFFFSGRRNQFAAIRIALAWKDLLESPLGFLPQAPPPAGKRGFFLLRRLQFRIRTSRSTSQPNGVSVTPWEDASLTALHVAVPSLARDLVPWLQPL